MTDKSGILLPSTADTVTNRNKGGCVNFSDNPTCDICHKLRAQPGHEKCSAIRKKRFAKAKKKYGSKKPMSEAAQESVMLYVKQHETAGEVVF